MKHLDLLVNENISIKVAMEKINENSKGILFVVSDNSQLLGAISDGDIRRALVDGKSINESIVNVYNKEPKVMHYYSKEILNKYKEEFSIRTVPLVDKENKILAVFHDGCQLERNKSLENIPVVIMAGGLGTRLYPYTKILPKPLIPIGDTPIIERIINQFELFGCKKFYIIVNHKKNMIISYFAETTKKYDIEFISEDIPLGTAGGLSLLKDRIIGDFIFTNCDIIINDDMVDIVNYHLDNKNVATMIAAFKKVIIPYGVIEEKDGFIQQLTEKPSFEFLTNTGLYVVNKETLNYIHENEVISMPEVCERIIMNNHKVGVYKILEDNWLDMGQIEELESMREKFI
ncbi:MAG: sugar phosphate nucleotidyltransferase [Erysipelotrichales bacterium]|nr:sugar phosphate nucleotidyltransferase [Erysipelotrichales bacterium]